MRRTLAWSLAVAVVVALAFGATTWVALEGNEVAVLQTRARDGGVRRTRVWVVDHAGLVWIESPTPERPWYRDVLADPHVRLERASQSLHYRAQPVAGPDGHRQIRSLLADKYGWADTWVGLLQDTSRSIAVRLLPLGAASPSEP